MSKLLIAGCSHAAGSEIDGSLDSKYNRNRSFGNLLAKKLNKTPINIASPGATNQTIARSVLEWINTHDTKDLTVLVAWTEPFRMEITAPTGSDYTNECSDNTSESDNSFLRVTPGYYGNDRIEKAKVAACNKMIAACPTYLEILTANLILQLQYLFEAKSIPYVMCNSMETFDHNDTSLKCYTDLIDQTYYLDMFDRNSAFYWKYDSLGYTNTQAKYLHHSAAPHQLYAEELFNFLL